MKKKRPKPKDIVDRQTWRIARLAAMLIQGAPEISPNVAVQSAINLMDEAQRQCDADLAKGAEELK